MSAQTQERRVAPRSSRELCRMCQLPCMVDSAHCPECHWNPEYVFKPITRGTHEAAEILTHYVKHTPPAARHSLGPSPLASNEGAGTAAPAPSSPNELTRQHDESDLGITRCSYCDSNGKQTHANDCPRRRAVASIAHGMLTERGVR